MKKYILLLIAIVAFGCSSGPKPIDYGNDQCDFCQMTIVDKRYGSELVSETGKVFKFDAIECMVNYYKRGEIEREKLASYLVTDYTNPGELIDAIHSHYLVSDQLPSPMGLNITAFKDETTANEFQQENSGRIYTWNSLNEHFNQLSPLADPVNHHQ